MGWWGQAGARPRETKALDLSIHLLSQVHPVNQISLSSSQFLLSFIHTITNIVPQEFPKRQEWRKKEAKESMSDGKHGEKISLPSLAFSVLLLRI